MNTLLAELRRLQVLYAKARPASAQAYEAACTVQPGGTTRSNLHLFPFPVTIDHADGSILTDLDGHTYIDLLSDFAVAMAGHSNDVIRNAIQKQLTQGISFGGRSEAETELAEIIVARFASIERVRFTNSGTEANLYAFLLARAITQRPGILMFEGGYLGGAMSFATSDPRLRAPFDFITVPYNDIEAFDAAISAHGSRLACVATELMLNSGGCIQADGAFIRHVENVCRNRGILFLVDEVMTSRLHVAGLQALYGVRPDITTLGKIIGGGLSIGAIGGRSDILKKFDLRSEDPLFHNGSFNNNVLSMRAGAASLRHVLTESGLSHTNSLGESLRIGMNADLASAALPLSWTGMGSVMALHIGREAPTRFMPHPAEKPLRALLHMDALLKGYWIAPRGMLALSVENTPSQLEDFRSLFRTFTGKYEDLIRALVPTTIGAA